MKKSVAARNHWFQYTARRRYDEQMRRSQRSMQSKFTHSLSSGYKIMARLLRNVFFRILWMIRFYVKKVWS